MAKRLIEDIEQDCDLEISWVRRGANPMAKVFLKKSAGHQPQTETTNMALKSVVLAGLMASAAGVALAKSFKDEAEIDAFVAKSDTDQEAALVAFAKEHKIDHPGVEKTGGEDTKTEVNKSDTVSGGAGDDVIAAAVAKAMENSPIVKALQAENETLKTRLEKAENAGQTVSLQKRAETEFKGLGIGVEKTVNILKAITADGFDADVRADIEAVFKAHGELAAKLAIPLGLTAVHKDAKSATAQITKMAEDLAKAEKIPLEEAFYKVNTDPANAELVEKADQEEAAVLRAA